MTFEADGLETPLTLKGTVALSSASEHGKDGQFGVEFEHPPMEELLRLTRMFHGDSAAAAAQTDD